LALARLLLNACEKGHEEVARMLLVVRADMEKESNNRGPPVHRPKRRWYSDSGRPTKGHFEREKRHSKGGYFLLPRTV